jgi:hypothetical protein
MDCTLSRVQRSLLIGALLAAATPMAGAADDFANFRMTGIDGRITLDYLGAKDTTESAATSSRHQIDDLRLTAMVNTHNYIYHPNFILLDISGGPIFESLRTDDNGTVTSSQATPYNFSTRASILPGKPYSGHLYFEHLNPTQSAGTSDIINLASERYGFDVSLLKPVIPLPLFINANHRHDQGRSTLRIVDEETSQASIRTSFTPLRGVASNFSYQTNDLNSRNGNTGGPIQPTQSTTEQVTLDTTSLLGENRQTNVHNWIRYLSQIYQQSSTPIPDTKNLDLTLNVATTHRPGLTSYGDYTYAHITLGSIESNAHALGLGGNWSYTLDTQLTGRVRADQTDATQYKTSRQQLEGGIRHSQRLPIGTLQTNYNLLYSVNDQEATAGVITVQGERIVFTLDTTQVQLAQANITPGSVRVWQLNTAGTARTGIEYLVGVDFALDVVPPYTRIQRLAGGAIGATETVEVDYTYDLGGSYNASFLSHNLDLNWLITSYLSTYFRYARSDPHINSGTATTPLNAYSDYTVGVRSDVPIRVKQEVITLGGYLEHEDRDETLAPFKRQSGEFYLLTDIPGLQNSSLRIGTRMVRVDAGLAANTAQNMELRANDIALNWRHYSGLTLSLTGTAENNRIGLVPQTRRYATLRGNWIYRKLALAAELTHNREEQGGYRHAQTNGRLTLQRVF